MRTVSEIASGAVARSAVPLTRAIAFDTEWSILPESAGAPVCVQYCEIDLMLWPPTRGPARVLHARDPATREVIRGWLVDPATLLVGHGAHNDTAIVADAYELRPEVEAAYADARVGCTMLREKLVSQARPGKIVETTLGAATAEDDDDDVPDYDAAPRGRRVRVVRKYAGTYGSLRPVYVPKRGLPADLAAVVRRRLGIESREDKTARIPAGAYRKALGEMFSSYVEGWADVEPLAGTAADAAAGEALWELLDETRADGKAGRPGRDRVRAAAKMRQRRLTGKVGGAKPAPEDLGQADERLRGIETREDVRRVASAALYAARPWRFRYGELLEVPVEEWPEEARRYCEDDATHTADAWIDQLRRPSDPWTHPHVRWWDRLAVRRGVGGGAVQYSHEAQRAHFAYHLERAMRRGVRVDRAQARRAWTAYDAVRDAAGRVMERHGVARPRDGTGHEDPEDDVPGALISVTRAALIAQATAAYLREGAPEPGLTSKGLQVAGELEGRPLHEWPEAARAYLSTAGYQLRRVVRAPADHEDAADLLRLGAPGLVAAGWEPDRIEAALGAFDYPALAAASIFSKAHAYGYGMARRLAEADGEVARSRVQILLDTGRIALSGDVGQNVPREGGIRECLIPRPGFAFIDADYSQIELVAFALLVDLAQGYHGPLSAALNAGRDAHLILAGDLLARSDGLHLTYDELEAIKDGRARPELLKRLKNTRQDAKALNYGLGANMGEATFVRTQAKAGNLLTIPQAVEGKALWRARWQPDAYFAWIGGARQRYADNGGLGVSAALLPPGGAPEDELVRGGLTYTQTANTYFQTIVAFGFARAWVAISLACEDPRSPLYGFYPLLPVHDQILAEGPAERAPEALAELQRIMVREMEVALRGMRVATKGDVRARWGK